MAEIYSIPDNGGSTPQFTIPIGGLGNGGMFGNGFNSIADLFGLSLDSLFREDPNESES